MSILQVMLRYPEMFETITQYYLTSMKIKLLDPRTFYELKTYPRYCNITGTEKM